MPVINMPDYPALGVPSGVKQAGQRVDFKPTQFELAIETKGYLLLWERATWCPCSPVTTQTEQPDPNCTLCKGMGWIYFAAPSAQDLSDYEFGELENQLITDTGGMVIRGIVTAIANQPDPLDVMSNWVRGSSNLTVRYENKLGYYDKVTALNAEIAFSEVVTTDGTEILPTRYPAVGVNYLRSVDTVYRIGVEYEINKGVVTWRTGYVPSTDTRVGIHYLCHPTWLVVEHPHAARVTPVKFKTPSPKTPTGDPEKLPVQALIRYEFLPDPT